MRMKIKTNKIKIMIRKFRKVTYTNVLYDNNNLEEVTSYKYLEVELHHKLN
jgi:hypothetical protein